MAVGLYSGVSGLALGIGLYRNVSGLWGGASGLINGFGGADPYAGASLYLNFLNPELDSRITFSRGTNATLIDSTGRLTYAPANLLQRSQEITVSPWAGDTSGGTVPTATANAGIAPDGTNTATRLQINRGAGAFSRWQQIGISGPSNLYIASIWMRTTSGTGTANVGLRNDVDGVNCVVTGTWQRFSIRNLAPTVVPNIQILSWTSIPGTDVSADILVWGAQLEPVTYQTTPSTYVATTASAYYGPRFDYDPVTLAPRGLLIEEARTNLLTYSEQFNNVPWSTSGATITANATASPDGTANADALVEDASTGLHITQQFFTFLNATAYTVSVYIKAGTRTWVQVALPAAAFTASQGGFFNLTGAGSLGTVTGTPTSRSITAVGNGWYRITITATSTAAAGGNIAVVAASADGTTSYAGTNGAIALFPWGAQLEIGSFATSYIPTVASTVTRNADVATMTGTNFSSWFNQSEGTFVSAFDVISTAGISKAVVTTNDGTSNNLNLLYVSSGAVPFGEIRSGGAVQALMSSATITAITVNAGALAYKVNDFASAVNGGAVATDTAGAVAVNQNALNIGYSSNFAGLYINGHIRTIAYFNTRLPNAQLQTLTAPSLAPTLSLDFTSGSYNVGF